MSRTLASTTGETKRIGFISLGCSKNLVDTEVMLGHLIRAGWEFVQDPAGADVIVVNTCSFIEDARQESIQTILEAAEYKKTGRLRRLVVAGCMVQRYAQDLRRELPEVDAFLGLDELHRIVEGVGGAQESTQAPLPSDLPLIGSEAAAVSHAISGKPASRTSAPWSAAHYLYDDTTPRVRATPRWTGYLKISEGCDHTCAFCAIPSFRGKFRSREPDSIVREATAMSHEGLREINLIAQDSSHYGRDLGMREGLSGLLESLDSIELLRWVRLHYLYPNTVTQSLIDTMAGGKRILDYVDLPLQHAHPDMLRRMRRGGSAEQHRELLDRFRRAMPEATLRSTLIVGFPGETEQEFQTLLDFVSDVRFDHLGVFTYSHEQGTSAWSLEDDVAPELKLERRNRLMELQQQIAFERNRLKVGRQVEVLVEGAHAETEHLLVGRMRGQAPDVDGQVLINDGTAETGEFVQVQLTETAGYDLVGRIVDRA